MYVAPGSPISFRCPKTAAWYMGIVVAEPEAPAALSLLLSAPSIQDILSPIRVMCETRKKIFVVPRAECRVHQGFLDRDMFRLPEEPLSNHKTILYTTTGAFPVLIGSILCVNLQCKCSYMGEEQRIHRYSTSTMMGTEIGTLYDKLCHSGSQVGFGYSRFCEMMAHIYDAHSSPIKFVSDQSFADWYNGWAGSQVRDVYSDRVS